MKHVVRSREWTILLFFFCLAGFACTDEIDPQPDKSAEGEAVPILLSYKQENKVSDLKYSLYIFHQPAGVEDYELIKTLSLTPDKKEILLFEPVSDAQYRFLFVATPETRPEIRVGNQNNSEPAVGMKWVDLIISSTDQPLSTENYYAIVQQTGSKIKEAGQVNGILKRLVGQVTFAFYRAEEGNTNNPIDVDPSRALSVFDRVYSIEATYSQYPYAVTFKSDTTLHPLYRDEDKMMQSWNVTLNTQLQAEMPQPANLLDSYKEAAGAVNMKGACFFPDENHFVVNMVFKYYDTLPICKQTEVHTTTCYTEKTLDLKLCPKENNGFSVRNGYFTVNRIAISQSRVIDIRHQTELEVVTCWKEDTDCKEETKKNEN